MRHLIAHPSRLRARVVALLAATAALASVASPAQAAPGDIHTYAGGGYTGCCDGSPATAARLWFPNGVAFDPVGNLYIADTDNHRIRRIDPAGIITTVAGTGVCGYTNGLAIAAKLCHPTGLAYDSVGGQSYLYIADRDSNAIRRLSLTSGFVTTLAGTGVPGFNGDGFTSQSRLFGPQGVAVDAAHNVYIADTLNHRVRKVTPSAGLITTVAGLGVPGYFGDGLPAIVALLNAPTGVAVDAAGSVWIADRDNSLLRRVTPMGIMESVVLSLDRPLSLTYDPPSNKLYVSDSGANRVVALDLTAGTDATVAGVGSHAFFGDGGLAPLAGIAYPGGVAVHPLGNAIFIGDRDNHRIRRVSLVSNLISTYGGTGPVGDTLVATNASLSRPEAVAVDQANGLLYIADRANQRVRRVDLATGVITTIAGGTGWRYIDGMAAVDALLLAPSGVALNPSNTILYVSDESSQAVRAINLVTGAIFTAAGTGDGCAPKGSPGLCGDGGPATGAKLTSPNGLAVDTAGALYIADTSVSSVRRVSPSGQITTVAGHFCPTSAGCPLGDGGPSWVASLENPRGVSVDSANNLLYVADTGNGRIRKVNLTTGIITTVAGCTVSLCGLGDGGPATQATLAEPWGVLYDAVTSRLYIGDTYHHRVRKVALGTGIITTVSGNGAGNFSGDGFPAIFGGLNRPEGLALDASGNLYIADEYNDRVRRILAPVP